MLLGRDTQLTPGYASQPAFPNPGDVVEGIAEIGSAFMGSITQPAIHTSAHESVGTAPEQFSNGRDEHQLEVMEEGAN